MSRCRSPLDTEHLFSTMPWTALPHFEAAGPVGDALMALYGITTIPALVLLDGTGTVVCKDGRGQLVDEHTRRPVPDCDLPKAARAGAPNLPPDPRLDLRRVARPLGSPRPVPDCDLPKAARAAPPNLPPDPRLDLRRVARPLGSPPLFPETARMSRRSRKLSTPPLSPSLDRGVRPIPSTGDPREIPPLTLPPRTPPTSPSMRRPPPKPNLPRERAHPTRPRVEFAASAITSRRVKDPLTRRRPTASRTSYTLTAAQQALLASTFQEAPASAPTRAPSAPPTLPEQVGEGPRGSLTQGKPLSLMQPQPLAGVHPFTPTLHKWRRGITVDCGPDWSWSAIEAAIARGPHPTACTPAAVAVFHEDIAYQVDAGFCKVLLWEDLKRLRPANLKISPVALVPQAGRRGRIILDLSFPVYQEVNGTVTVTQDSVNSTTVLSAPSIPVKEIGKVLPRLLQYMRDTPTGLHILFSKLDISDGFWRLVVREGDAFNFAYVLPQAAGKPCRIVLPAAVQMGWVESPALFCTVTESARDLTQHLIDANVTLPWDAAEDSMQIADIPLRARTDTPTKLLQVYVDDFCHAATQSTDGLHIPTIRRAAIHGIHAFFPPPALTQHVNGKEPISQKKLAQGDGNFDTTKEMIGFIFDGVKRTVRLPARKALAYIKEAHKILRRKTVPLKALQMLVGKLRHASIILPAATGFFTPINTALRGSPKIVGLGASSELRAALEDIISLLKLLSSRPTHVNELVADMPKYAGYHDAAAEGAGGVWFSLVDNMVPMVWRNSFPQDIASDVISDANPDGGITNSDLELAAEVLAIGVILDRAPWIKHAPLGTLCDNTPTVSWVEKMASKAKTPTAGRLLRGLAFMLHCSQTGRLTTVHVPGSDNVMADIASRPSTAQKLFPSATALSDTAFCSAFDTAFPLPDKQPWALASTPPWVRFNVYETLRGKRLALQQWTGPSGSAHGKHGQTTTVPSMAPTPPITGRLPRTNSSRLLLPCGRESTVSVLRSRFNRSSGLSGMSPKSSFWTDIPTPESLPRPNNPSTSLLPD